ncbi:spore coat protein CotJB [Texcoconibacillus texcoconensis]|uniref:Spore coat protein JB n=1 Tax=Texcoconibacillus texcoconensis TaxID=1095777 RepID=A0A840QLY4_9BACI|nr:spore coat protein CotJB [Texcoconibacillus texcoconensis]MBB5172385.1 spore coat protein JB [Texcoconibacillus texcoconensis]
MAQKQLPKEFYKSMEELQAVDFVILELTLYLDTHPNDEQAIQQFNHMTQVKQHLMYQVEQYYGPLQQFGNSYSGSPWNWKDAPWPWQI